MQLPAVELTGVVVDQEGAVVQKAIILVHWDSAGSSVGLKTNQGSAVDLRTNTDDFGHFKMKLAPGFYDIFVMSGAFSPACRKVRLLNAKTETQKFVLKVNQLVSSELADTFDVPANKSSAKTKR